MTHFPKPNVVAEAMALVAPAEAAFRSRWRLTTLKRIDAELHQNLVEQIDLYSASLVTGSDADTREHAAAMVRGWRAACAALETPLAPDDAYLVGVDWHTGTRVVISDSKVSVARVQSIKGERVVMVSPDEVAKMFASLTILAEAKTLFPDAEIVEILPTDVAAE